MPHSFKYGHSNALQWRDAALACLAQIGEIPTTANLGFIYVTDSFAPHLAAMLDVVKAATGIAHWVGSTGVGICSTGQEYLDQPAVAIMLGEFPQNTFKFFPRYVTRMISPVQYWWATTRPILGSFTATRRTSR